jgi:hypothetical protein
MTRVTSFDNVLELSSRLSSFAAMPSDAGTASVAKILENSDCMDGSLDKNLSFFSLLFKANVPIRS